jgi:serine/threonine protein kinase
MQLFQMNILIDDAENAVLCDFGLTRMKTEVTAAMDSEAANAVMGSRNWMAPERLMGRVLKRPADIYAFGMTIYEVSAPAYFVDSFLM